MLKRKSGIKMKNVDHHLSNLNNCIKIVNRVSDKKTSRE